MLKTYVKTRLIDFFHNNINPRTEALQSEAIFQGIFNQQCANRGMTNDYYPVGAAASYSLMYLLTRILTELPVRSIVELGSGQTSLLIDRLRDGVGSHICYENNPAWFEHLAARLTRCDYRLRPIAAQEFSGQSYEGYADLEPAPFDLLLVDGPNGTDHRSRYSCLPLLADSVGRDFVVIIDDADRPGERETIREAKSLLAANKVDFKLNFLRGRTTQAVITTARFRAASFFF